MSRLDNDKEIFSDEAKRITQMDHVLGKGLYMPFNNNNSGPRKILAGIQTEHSLCLYNPEVPIVQTGYENKYGDRSASVKKMDSTVVIRAKIEKFEHLPGHHYYLIVTDDSDNSISIIERISYKDNTESYGYILNNSTLDSYNVGDTINKGTIIVKSSAYDQYNNSCMGVNLTTGYLAEDDTMEDANKISLSGALKLASPLIYLVKCNINDNDILLNLMGTDDNIKSFCDVGEDIQNGILLATRREKNEDCLYMQSKNKLRELVMSDTSYQLQGKVIDIDIFCNSPDKLVKRTNTQLKYYYDNKQRYTREIVEAVDELKRQGYTRIKGALDRIYNRGLQEINAVQYIDKGSKIYSGTEIWFAVMKRSIPNIGDKLTNRCGGKGVIGKIVPDEMMPMIEGSNERLELILNSSTCTNRLNNGQLKEQELTFIGSEILRYISSNPFTVDEALEEVLKYISMCSPVQAQDLRECLNHWDTNYKKEYLYSMIESKCIVLSMEPITESITLDKLSEIYKAFPYVQQRYLYVPIQGSSGNIRMIRSRRPVICGKIYIYRLKQYAEDKFSVTSLSSTNIRNQNSRSKASKNFKSIHQNTPIRIGEMENGDFSHMGIEIVKSMMMLYSSSPHGRLLMQKLYVDDPYDVDIKLDEKAVDRSAEIFNVRFKTIGLRLKFTKKKRVYNNPIMRYPIVRDYGNYITPVMHVSKEERNFDIQKDFLKNMERAEAISKQVLYHDAVSHLDPSKDNLDEYQKKLAEDTEKLGFIYKK